MSTTGLTARIAATGLLSAVVDRNMMLAEALERRDSPIAKLAPEDRARAQSLATTCLRHLQGLDAVLAGFFRKKPPPAVQNVLRICAAEILIDGIASHGAVNAAVTQVKTGARTRNFAGLTNAVARKLATEGAPVFAAQPEQNLPHEFRQRLVRRFGKEAVGAIEQAHQKGAALDLTIKSAGDREKYAQGLSGTVLPNGSVRVADPGQISTLDGFEQGDWWVQDAAACIPALCFGDLSGKRVLDICAAPGGKTLQLAAAGAQVTALDISDRRLELVAENLQRTGLRAELVTADATDWQTEETFDAILVDAPCSATGTVRRHPDLPFAKPTFDLRELLALQRAMITRACGWLKPGGQLVFSTCSLFREEGEGQAEWIEKSELDLRQVALDPERFGLPAEASVGAGGLQLRPDFWPEHGGMDGFFIAKFQIAA